MCKKLLVVAALLLALAGAREASAQEILVFGSPGLTSGNNTVTRRFADWGFNATIVDGATWGSLTTADFAQYDAIYTDGLCASVDWAPQMAANQDAMMAAVRGRVYLSVADPDAHTTPGGTAPADRATLNALTWATALGSTESGGATGLVFHSGCAEFGGIDIFGQFPSFGAITTVFNNVEGNGILTPAHPTMTTPNALVDTDFHWSVYCHGSMDGAAIPAGYTSRVDCAGGNIGVITREALPTNVLVYGPSSGGSGTGGSVSVITGFGYTVTVADAAGWCSMTTDDFAQFDAIYFDGNWPTPTTEPTTCGDLGGTGGTWADIVVETESVWGPTINGRIYLATSDPAFHIGGTGPNAAVENAMAWATSGGSTGSGGRTGLVLYTGGLETTAGVFVLEQLGATLGTFVTTTTDVESGALLNADHPGNTTPNLLDLASYQWGNYCHGTMSTVPANYAGLSECAGGDLGTVVRDFADCGNGTAEPALGEECDGTDILSLTCSSGFTGTPLCNNDLANAGRNGTCSFDGDGCTDIDECTAGTDDCVDAASGGVCTNTTGSWTCSCTTGYTGDGTTGGTGCTDIDECTLGTDDCDTNAVCANTSGSFTCTCNAGYAGDGHTSGTGCVDVDECTLGTDNCADGADGGVCTNTDGGFSCSCASGYTGDGVLVSDGGTGCTDIDECTLGTDTCVDGAGGGVCTNTAGGYSCSCMTGYSGDGDTGGTGCTDIDECTLGTDDCTDAAAGGVCTNTTGSWTCSCATGYTGDGTTGGTGCTDIDECTAGTDDCVDGSAGGVCTNTDGSWTCSCATGYTGDGTTGGTGCTDLDECTLGTDDCDTNAVCANTDGGFDCTCNDGYSGDGHTGGTGCLDEDECTLGTDDCDTNATCTNTDGGFDCACADGYTGDGTTCTDVDECTDGTDTCDDNATCENTDGGYTCTCNDGFSGDGETCSEVDPGTPDAGTGGNSGDDGGCGCRVAGKRSAPGTLSGMLLLGLGLMVVRRRRRRR